jgi:plasmid stability protein
MTSLTVRNVPEDAKRRFRQVAAAHGRSMEEHLRQMIIEADFGDAPSQGGYVADVRQGFKHEPMEGNVVQKLLQLADGPDVDLLDRRKYAAIRFLTAKDAMAELRRLANGVGFNPLRQLNTKLEAPDF